MKEETEFSKISEQYRSKLTDIFRKYDIPETKVDEVKLVPVEATQPIDQEVLEQVALERWTVYAFTLPVRATHTKKLAFGFASKEEAKDYIDRHLVKRDEDGNVIPKVLEDNDGNRYHIKYDTIRESVEHVNVYYNEPKLTTVGNKKEDVLEAWLG